MLMKYPVIRKGIMWLALSTVAVPAMAATESVPAPTRRLAIIKMVREDCGSCHGSRLTGSLGPALTPQALLHKNSTMLIDTILDGRTGTPMPPWKPFLTRNEATWIVERLKRGFPDAP